MTQAVILAGGKGTRLASRLNGRPKALVDVAGVALLERQIRLLAQHGITEIAILVNHAADRIERYLADHGSFGVRTRLIDDGEPRGTAGAVLAAFEALAERFLVVYGDTMINVDLARFMAAHREAGADATLFLHPNDHPHDSDIVELDESGWVCAFHPYPHPEGAFLPNLVNAALYMIERRALEPYRQAPVPSDFGKNLFPQMLRDGVRIRGYRSFEYIKDLGTPARLEKVERHLAEGLIARASLSEPQKAVFVDRDGTLNIHRGFIRNVADIDLVPGAGRAIARLNALEFRVAIITNQPVIARGEVTSAELRRMHAKIETLLAREGGYVDGIFVCPHHPDSGYPGEVATLKIDCDCRKPKTGLIEDARRALNIDLTRSWFVGDTTSDMLAAKRAGIRSILVRTGEGGQDSKYAAAPDHVVDDLEAAVELIAGEH
jgi:histidinol-phosphate phosphatase family protein